MSKELSFLAKNQKKIKEMGRVTNNNKNKLRQQLNKLSGDYGFEKLDSKASIAEIRKAKNEYVDRIGYDILSMSINEGNTVMAFSASRDLKKSKDDETKRLAKNATALASAKHYSNRYLKQVERDFLERGNQNIKGYGNEDLVTLFEKTKNKRQIKNLIDEIKYNNPNREFVDKQIQTFERVFQKVGIVREGDLEQLKNGLKKLGFSDLVGATNRLLESLEIYGSETNVVGAWGDEETELANARLDDTLIKMGIKKTGSQKVNKILKKYK